MAPHAHHRPTGPGPARVKLRDDPGRVPLASLEPVPAVPGARRRRPLACLEDSALARLGLLAAGLAAWSLAGLELVLAAP
jgi:hypothetical protein